ncbi:hypothetical protein CRG98_044576 [Punica granatum]|uniref:S-locus glycoprotein domain-containing protein n=1 Tax=Punica granatum TaxID=22663 RepID=A0A2I0HTW2_PUNGR|nr:hypothetical protein CRG98_044576 [Punica granatum]
MRISHSHGKTALTSWKSPSDPSIGKFSMGIDPAMSIPEIFIWKEGSPYYRSGPWNGQAFIGVPRMNSVYLQGVRVANDDQGTVYLTYSFANESLLDYFQLNHEGNLVELYWDDGKKRWEIGWLARESECDYYGKCGEFGTCDSKMAYAYVSGIGCMVWYLELVDIQKFSENGVDLYIRVAASEIGTCSLLSVFTYHNFS